MHRTTLMLPDALRDSLRRIALERDVSMASVVREALEEHVARTHTVPRSLGIGASGSTGTARETAIERAEARPWR